jgi:SPP1 family predicted phage head-tail adaptor
MVRAGKHRHLVSIKKTVESRNSLGEVANTWVVYAQRWASITPLAGREYWAARQVNAENTVKFTMRYCQGVTTKMVIVYDNRTFKIDSIINTNDANREMIVMTTEEV